MANKSGNLLSTITDFPADAVTKLAELWITTADEYASAFNQVNGRSSLAKLLGMTIDQVDGLQTLIKPFLPEGLAFDDEDIPVVLGAILEEQTLAAAAAAAAAAELPKEINFMDKMPPVRQQGSRGTCVAHASAALREYILGENSTIADLSEQFLYWGCKQRDNYHGEGTFLWAAMGVLSELGVCPEAIWPYNPEVNAASEDQGPPPENAGSEAEPYRLKTKSLSATNIDELRTALAQELPVVFAIPLYASCQRPVTHRGGDMRLPLPDETMIGGHAMCMVGYVNDDTVPGGGYFIVRNSWGEQYGYYGEVAPGYCRLPYAYLQKYGNSAFTAVK